jgi:hypothetical protein
MGRYLVKKIGRKTHIHIIPKDYTAKDIRDARPPNSTAFKGFKLVSAPTKRAALKKYKTRRKR